MDILWTIVSGVTEGVITGCACLIVLSILGLLISVPVVLLRLKGVFGAGLGLILWAVTLARLFDHIQWWSSKVASVITFGWIGHISSSTMGLFAIFTVVASCGVYANGGNAKP